MNCLTSEVAQDILKTDEGAVQRARGCQVKERAIPTHTTMPWKRQHVPCYTTGIVLTVSGRGVVRSESRTPLLKTEKSITRNTSRNKKHGNNGE